MKKFLECVRVNFLEVGTPRGFSIKQPDTPFVGQIFCFSSKYRMPTHSCFINRIVIRSLPERVFRYPMPRIVTVLQFFVTYYQNIIEYFWYILIYSVGSLVRNYSNLEIRNHYVCLLHKQFSLFYLHHIFPRL